MQHLLNTLTGHSLHLCTSPCMQSGGTFSIWDVHRLVLVNTQSYLHMGVCLFLAERRACMIAGGSHDPEKPSLISLNCTRGGPRVFLWLASGSKKFAYSYKEIFAPCYFKFSLRSSFLKVMWYCTHTHYTHMYAHIYTHMSVYGKKTDWISDSPLLSLMFKGFYNSVSTCPSKTHVGIYSQCNHAARWSPMGMFTVKAPERDCLSSRHRSAGAWFPGSCEALFSHKSHQNGSGFRVMGLQLSSVFLPPLQKMQY